MTTAILGATILVRLSVERRSGCAGGGSEEAALPGNSGEPTGRRRERAEVSSADALLVVRVGRAEPVRAREGLVEREERAVPPAAADRSVRSPGVDAAGCASMAGGGSGEAGRESAEGGASITGAQPRAGKCSWVPGRWTKGGSGRGCGGAQSVGLIA